MPVTHNGRGSFVKGSMKATYFYQVSMHFCKPSCSLSWSVCFLFHGLKARTLSAVMFMNTDQNHKQWYFFWDQLIWKQRKDFELAVLCVRACCCCCFFLLFFFWGGVLIISSKYKICFYLFYSLVNIMCFMKSPL